MKSRTQVSMAGEAEPTVTTIPRPVSVSKRSAQPGMKCGDLKNYNRMRRKKRRRTWASCMDILPSSL